MLPINPCILVECTQANHVRDAICFTKNIHMACSTKTSPADLLNLKFFQSCHCPSESCHTKANVFKAPSVDPEGSKFWAQMKVKVQGHCCDWEVELRRSSVKWASPLTHTTAAL